jgi:flagellar motility protein MotE (MotC chaperone)
MTPDCRSTAFPLRRYGALAFCRIVLAVTAAAVSAVSFSNGAVARAFNDSPLLSKATSNIQYSLGRDAGRADDYIVVAAGGGHEADPHGAKKPKEPEAEPPIPKSDAIDKLPQADQYCARVGELAASSQFAQQRKALASAQQELEARIKTLTKKSEEIKAWTKKREDFLAKATEGLLAIYGKMKPEIAATQLVAMSQTTAAAIVAKLPPKAAGAILAEMDPQRAARLSSVLAGAIEIDDKPAPPSATGTP